MRTLASTLHAVRLASQRRQRLLDSASPRERILLAPFLQALHHRCRAAADRTATAALVPREVATLAAQARVRCRNGAVGQRIANPLRCLRSLLGLRTALSLSV